MPAQEPVWASSYGPGVPLHLDHGDTTLTGQLEATIGSTRAVYNPIQRLTDQTSHYEVAGAVRKWFGGLWIGLALKYAIETDHVSYLDAKRNFDTTSPPIFAVGAAIGYAFWRQL